MAPTRFFSPVRFGGRVRFAGRLVLSAALGTVAAFALLPPSAQAGFEWSPPVRTAPATQAPAPATSAFPAPSAVGGRGAPAPLTSSDLNAAPAARSGVVPVMAQPLSPLAPLPPVAPSVPPASAASAGATVSDVPPIDLQPLKSGATSRRNHLTVLQSVQAPAPTSASTAPSLSVQSGAFAPPPPAPMPAPLAPLPSAMKPPSASETPPDFVPPAVIAERRAQAAALAPLSAPSAAPASRFPEAVGFGRDMPLALAMRQVIPAAYGFSFAEGVDAGQRVSWSGGKPWDQVLDAALRPAGLGASISGSAVHIAPLPSGMSRPAPISARPQAAPLRSLPSMPETAARRDDLMPLPSPSLVATPDPAPAPAVAPLAATPPRAFKGVDAQALPDPRAPAPFEGFASREAGRIVPMAEPAGASDFPKGLIKSPGPSDLPRLSERPMDLDGNPVASSGVGVDRELPRPPAGLRALDAAPLPTKVMPASFPAKSSGIAAHGFDMNAVQDWSAPAGATLRRILTDWSEKAGVQLHWSSQFDYPIQASIRMTGTYQKAVETLLDGLRDAKPRPLARLHPNLPAGPAILILQTQHVIN